MKYLQLIIKSIILTMFISCTNTEEELNIQEVELSETNSLITISNPPINLQGVDACFAENIAYDIYEETIFDVFLPKSSTATPMVIYIHGGGFRGGDKNYIYAPTNNIDYPMEIKTLLANRVAVATINYRLLDANNETEGVLKPLNDVKRALQYIRSIAKNLNVNKNQIILTGNSAGAGAALWLATNDDFKNLSSNDLVLHESTRVNGIALRQTQSSYDIENRWINDVFVDYNLVWEEFAIENIETLMQFYGISSINEYNTPEIDTYRERVDMLSSLTSDDPEIWCANIYTLVEPPIDESIAYHHAFHAREIKERADIVGVKNVTYYGRNPILFSDPSNETLVDFILRKTSE